MFRTISFALGVLSLVPSLAQDGSSCSLAVPIGLGTHTAPSDNYYYAFIPTQTGSYIARTCGLATCDTKLWAYDHCAGLIVDEGGAERIGVQR